MTFRIEVSSPWKCGHFRAFISTIHEDGEQTSSGMVVLLPAEYALFIAALRNGKGYELEEVDLNTQYSPDPRPAELSHSPIRTDEVYLGISTDLRDAAREVLGIPPDEKEPDATE